MKPGGSTPDRALQPRSTGRRITHVGGRARNLERRFEQPNVWHYVTPIAPATDPDDLIAGDPVAPIFTYGYGNTADEQPLSFRLHPLTKVQIRSGPLSGGTIPGVVFTLPAGFTPLLPVYVTFPSSDGLSVFTGRIDIDGKVWILGSVT